MVLFGIIGLIRINWLYSGKIVVFGQKWFYSGNKVVFGEKWLYSGKVVLFRQNRYYSSKSGSIQAKVVVFGQKRF